MWSQISTAKGGRPRITKELQLWDSYQLLAFQIVDLTVHGRWHIFRVDRNPQCSGSFACLRSRPSLANRNGPNVEVVVARSGRTLVKGSLAQLRPDLYSKGGGARITNELQLRDSYQLLSSII